ACRPVGCCGTRPWAPCRPGFGWRQRCRRPGSACSWESPESVVGAAPGARLARRRLRSVAQGLARLEHVADAVLGLVLLGQLDEMAALQLEQPVLVHQRATVDLAAADHGGDAGGDLVVVLADEAALQHVD